MSEKVTICIPTYWTAEAGQSKSTQLLNAYDHPTPIDTSGTLERCLNSLVNLKGDFRVVIIGTMTEPELHDRFQKKLKNILDKFRDLDLYWFSYSELTAFHKLLEQKGAHYQKKYVSLEGYSNIRNLCLILPHILGSKVAFLVDDDEVVTDKDIIAKALYNIGGTFDEEPVLAKTGLYVSEEKPETKPKKPWRETYWPKSRTMEEVFTKAKEGPRISHTPIALGGAMVVHRDLFTKVSFDPWMLRGEDIDYLINCKLHGYQFVSDNEFTVLHLAPTHLASKLSKMRQDIYRFVYAKEKLQYAFKQTKLHRFDIEDLDPYPGLFMRKSVGRRAFSYIILSAVKDIYRREVFSNLALINEGIIKAKRYARKNKARWFGFQRLWPNFMQEIKEVEFEKVLTKIE